MNGAWTTRVLVHDHETAIRSGVNGLLLRVAGDGPVRLRVGFGGRVVVVVLSLSRWPR